MEGRPQPSWPSAVVALGFLALIGFMFYLAVENDFETVWAGAGTIVGVAVGAIPSYFFHQQAQQAEARADAITAVADAGLVEEAQRRFPRAF